MVPLKCGGGITIQHLVGFLSDAHGNGAAFDRAIRILQNQGAQLLFFLGDSIGYVPTSAVLDSIERLGDQVQSIRGNHEAMFLGRRSDTTRERVYQLEALRPKLTTAQLAMLNSWPDSRSVVINGQRLLLVHGSPKDPTYGYIYPDTDLASFEPKADWVFMGNTHIPFIRKQENTCYVNVGSCSMPRDDARYGSVALLDSRERKVRILRFDITAEKKQVLEEFPMVHPSVRHSFQRRGSSVLGEML